MVSSGISGIKCLPNERLRKDFPLAPAPVSAVDEQQRSGIRFAPNEPPCRLNDANHARQGHAQVKAVCAQRVIITLHRPNACIRLRHAG